MSTSKMRGEGGEDEEEEVGEGREWKVENAQVALELTQAFFMSWPPSWQSVDKAFSFVQETLEICGF